MCAEKTIPPHHKHLEVKLLLE